MRLLDFIIAEDIRREIGNKVSVMGIFGEDIVLSPSPTEWPIGLHIGIFIRVFIDVTDKIPKRFLIKISLEGEKVAQFDGVITAENKIKNLILPLVANPLPIPKEGMLKFNLQLLYEDEVLLEENNEIEVRVTH